MKKNILQKCFLISFVAVAIVFFASAFVTYWQSRDNIKRNLIEDSVFFARIIEASGTDALAELHYRGDVRLTVVTRGGEVIFESENSEINENHADREEIKSALNGNPKIVERNSKTLGERMFYYAVAVGDGDEAFIVRLAVSSGKAGAFLGTSLPFAVLAIAVALLVSYLFAKRLSDAVTGQIKNIEASLRSFHLGKYESVSATVKDREIVSVVKEIDRLVESANAQKQRVAAEEAKLDYVVSHLNEGVVALNEKGEIVLLNTAANRMFSGDGKAKTLDYLIDDNALLEKIAAQKDRGGATFSYTSRGKDYVFSIQPREGAASDVKTVIFVSDVTKERLAVKERSEFFQNASHELKTPLTSVEGLSELMLAKEELSPQLRKYAERIHGEAKRMGGLVQDMLYISDLENNRRAEEAEEIELAPLANELFENYKNEAEQKRIAFRVVGTAAVTASRRNMIELLGNLIGNAVHYNREGGEVTAEFSERGGTVRIRVTDTGIGIAEKDLTRITERFYRVDKSRSKETGGTGLGLAIVKHVTELYRGDLTVESKLNEGTSVTIVFYKKTLLSRRKNYET